MNLLVLLAIAAVLVGLRFLKPNALAWAGASWVAIYLALSYGINPPLPSSILSMFMGIVTLALVTYLTAAADRMRSAASSLITFFTSKRYAPALLIVLILVPSLVAFRVYRNMTAAPQPPVLGRTIHPPPPGSITFNGRTINLSDLDNPYRSLETEDPEQFAERVANGRRVYYQNCVFCHGDDMRGDGQFAHGLDPIPANFQDVSTIAMLQEGYLFWRIAKGAPGLPPESTPWSSAMPAWEKFLTEEEIWDVISFLYDYTGHRPRAREEAH